MRLESKVAINSRAAETKHRRSIRMTIVYTMKIYTIALVVFFLCPQMVPGAISESLDTGPADSNVEISQLVEALGGESAIAEWYASQSLMRLGDAAVPTLAQLVSASGRLAPRLIAVEVLGKIGTKVAMDALLGDLKTEENLAVRGQICIQLGYAREERAIPIIAQWLAGIGPKSLNDVRGPKEVQPSTCYIRHAEALGMMGNDGAIPILEEFRKKIPQNIGYGGFVTNFVTGAVDQSLADIKDNAAFWKAVEEHDGLTERIAPIFRYFQSNNLSKYRFHESEVVRRTEAGKVILQKLTKHNDSELATAAKSLLHKYDDL